MSSETCPTAPGTGSARRTAVIPVKPVWVQCASKDFAVPADKSADIFVADATSSAISFAIAANWSVETSDSDNPDSSSRLTMKFRLSTSRLVPINLF